MALQTSAASNNGGALKFKQRGVNDKRKVMIYGNDGTGKSTYAETYCKKNNLHPVCIDIDDTNFTNVPIVEIDTRSDITTFNTMKSVLDELQKHDEFDTIIVDGVTSLLELLVSKSKGLSKYSDRAQRFQEILRKIQMSGKNIIWIGQADMKVIHTEDHQSNKQIVKINSIVNEKYHCYITRDGKYDVEVEKYRRIDEKESK